MQSKLPHVGTNIFSFMSNLAHEYQAINLAQGFPDYPIDEKLISFVHQAMIEGFNQYAPMIGMADLRFAISEKIKNSYQTNINHDTEITITPGATYAIYAALTSILFSGDEVIVLEPAYDCYIPIIESLGAKAVRVPLIYPDYAIDWQGIKEGISMNTKAIIINSPHNPTGYVWTKNDIEILAEIISKTNIIIISDEVYEHIIFDEQTHESVLKYDALRNRSFVVFSFGKTFHATGWKMGYCIAPPHLMNEFRKIHQFLCFSVNTPVQLGLANYLNDKNSYQSLAPFLEAKRNLFLMLLQKTPFTIHKPTQGSYFQLASYERINDLPDKEFAIWLTQKYGVATIPISAFNHHGKDDKLIRFCFAKKEETLTAAMEKLSLLTAN
jgi:methionine transaminase